MEPRRERFSECGIHGWLLRDSYLMVMPVPWRRSASYLQICTKNREPTSGLEPLTCSLRVCGRWLLSVARVCISAFLSGFLFPRLPTIAGYCVRVRVKLGSSILDSYAHWIPSMGRPVADGWTRRWARRLTPTLRYPFVLGRGATTKRRVPAASSPSPPPPGHHSRRLGQSRL